MYVKLEYRKISPEYFSLLFKIDSLTQDLGIYSHQDLIILRDDVQNMLDDLNWMVNVTEE